MDLLEAADFLEDTAMIDVLCGVLGERLFHDLPDHPTSQAPTKRSQILCKIPSHLVSRVLRCSPAGLNHQIAELSEEWHREAVHAAFPDLHTSRNLDLDCAMSSPDTTLAVLKEFQDVPGPKALRLRAVTLSTASPPVPESLEGLLCMPLWEQAALSPVFRGLATRPQRLSISFGDFNIDGMSLFATLIKLHNSIDHLEVMFHATPITDEEQRSWACIPGHISSVLSCQPQLKSFALASIADTWCAQHVVASNPQLLHALQHATQLTQLSIFWGYADAEIAHNLLASLPHLQDISLSIVPAEHLDSETAVSPLLRPAASSTASLAPLTQLFFVDCTDGEHEIEPGDFDSFREAWFSSVVMPRLSSAATLRQLDLCQVLSDGATQQLATLLRDMPDVRSFKVEVENPTSPMLAVVDALTAASQLSCLDLCCGNTEHQPQEVAHGLYTRLCKLTTLVHARVYSLMAGVPRGARQVQKPFGGVEPLPQLSCLSRLTEVELNGDSSLDGGISSLCEALPQLKSMVLYVDTERRPDGWSVASSLSKFSRLESLIVLDRTLAGRGIAELGAGLTTMSQLTLLSICCGSWEHHVLSQALSCLSCLGRLREMKLQNMVCCDNAQIVSNAAAAAFSQSTTALTCLEKLNIHCRLEEGALAHLSTGVSRLTTLRELAVCEKVCSCPHTCVTAATALPVASALRCLTKLTSLSIGLNLTNFLMARVLGRAISQLPRLAELALTLYEMGDEATAFLADGMLAAVGGCGWPSPVQWVSVHGRIETATDASNEIMQRCVMAAATGGLGALRSHGQAGAACNDHDVAGAEG